MKSEEPVVAALAPPDVESLLQGIYESAFYAVASFVSKHGGSFEDAREIFQEAFVILYEQYEAGREINTPERYLAGIAKNLWFKELRHRKRSVALQGNDEKVTADSAPIDDKKLLSLLERAGRKCLDLLEAFYFRKETLQSLRETFGFSSEHSAAVQKYKCIEKLRDELKTRSLSYEDFFE